MKTKITDFFKNLQKDIWQKLEIADGKGKFVPDQWQREAGGGGISGVLEKGNILEKGGVNFSAVWGKMPQILATRDSFGDGEFYATGVSIVLHPHNPFVPIIHMNVRYFEMNGGEKWWFGGGIDLTPHYIVPEDATYFHQQLKNVCDKHHHSYYPEFKKWADDYFFIKHRKETRGVGGIFFDRLSANDDFTLEDRFAFVQSVGNSFVDIYPYFMSKNKDIPFEQNHKEWQLLRRGRYVEFNLVYDAGTKFGLETDGRTESILMSLPQHASWHYNYIPQPNSQEEFTLNHLKKGIDWV
jgi:coproporphyrinogen III oxidase